MFERHTERAEGHLLRALRSVRIRESDDRHRAPSLGLLREGHGAADSIFRRSEITHDFVTKQLRPRAAGGAPIATSVDVPLSPAARRTLECANEEAERAGAPHIDTEHLLPGLLQQPDNVAVAILSTKGIRLEELREEVRLRAQASEPRRSRSCAFPKLAGFPQQLEERRTRYHVSPFRSDAIRVEVTLPEAKWMATFFADGRVAVASYSTAGSVEGEDALARLLDGLGPAQESGD